MSDFPAAAELKVEVGEALTHNVIPLLHEIRHALQRMLDTGEQTAIDLRSLPLAPGEEERLFGMLGNGEVQIRMSALGPSEIIETRFPGVWVVRHFNSDDEVVGTYIEICNVPGLVMAQPEDVRYGLEQLQTELDQ
ncbi:MAG: hydrogenase expression/formation C-terminal domain-containing protein [Thiohalobacterales bacterium]|nr:hydrogenase expression/formation C-terminal domain-containing protein [Thiohalobacterales bacterium]